MGFKWSVAARKETSAIPCPQCGVPLLRQTKYFCASCGWNRANIEEHWRFLMRNTLRLAAIVIPFFVLLFGLDTNWPFALILGIFPFSFTFAIAYLYQRAALKDLLAALPPKESPVPLELLEARVPKMHVFLGVAIVMGGVLMIWGIRWPGKFIPIDVTAGFTALFFSCFHKERA